jgi:hypothetical protein
MAAAPVSLYPGAASSILVGGSPVTAVYGGVLGGFIQNPALAVDQGLPLVENLYVDMVNAAALAETATTVPLPPGGTFVIPRGLQTNISINAASSGHQFSVIVKQQPTPFPPTPFPPNTFPPSGPISLANAIPSYLYEEYQDDDDLQAFVGAYNQIAQQVINWFNTINLPIYTGLSGVLLDWVAQGLYGQVRPSLSSGQNKNIGPFNTYPLNGSGGFNVHKIIGPSNITVTTDDFFKRIITWNFWKGDGRTFNIRWLKRRIMRFLIGVNGSAPNVDQTNQISVTFGVGNQVNISLLTGQRTVTGGAIFGRKGFGFNMKGFNELDSTFSSFTPLPNAAILAEAIESGALQLPFQFQWVVVQ